MPPERRLKADKNQQTYWSVQACTIKEVTEATEVRQEADLTTVDKYVGLSSVHRKTDLFEVRETSSFCG